jgi:hypothetical protein
MEIIDIEHEPETKVSPRLKILRDLGGTKVKDVQEITRAASGLLQYCIGEAAWQHELLDNGETIFIAAGDGPKPDQRKGITMVLYAIGGFV